MTIQDLFSRRWNYYVIAAIFLMGFLIRLLVQISYAVLIHQAEDMANSPHPLMKILKIKFDTCYQLKLGVNNVDTFVDKYVYKYKILGIYLHTWESFCGQSTLFVFLSSLVFGTLAVAYSCGKLVILSTLLSGILTGSLLLLLDGIWNFAVKRMILKVQIKDYLENIYKPRLEKEVFHPQQQAEYQQEYFEKNSESETKENPKETLAFHFTKEEQSIIEDVIKQYIV